LKRGNLPNSIPNRNGITTFESRSQEVEDQNNRQRQRRKGGVGEEPDFHSLTFKLESFRGLVSHTRLPRWELPHTVAIEEFNSLTKKPVAN